MSTQSPDDDDFRVPPPAPNLNKKSTKGDEWRGDGDWHGGPDIEPCTVYRDGPGTMGRVTTPLGDLSFANVFGGPVSMARQLGRRSATDLREGALPFLDRFMGDVAGAVAPTALSGVGNWVLENWLVGRLRQALPGEYLKVLMAYGEGSGFEVDRVVAGQLLWDIWGILHHAPVRRIRSATARSRIHSPLLGSLSMVLPSDEVGPLHLRWLDNTGVDLWDRKTSLQFFHPDQGIAYVMVSSVGFLTGLPAGMNAAGLTLTVEPGAGGGVDLSGVPLGPAAHQILSHAHTIEEAAALLRQQPAMTPWRYVFSEGDTGRTAVFTANMEGSGEGGLNQAPFVVAGADGTSGAEGRVERVERWHRHRRQSLDKILTQWSSAGEDAVFEAITAMTRQEATQKVVAGHPLSGLSNVGAVVFEPRQRRLWVAAGRAPASRRWFVPMSLRSGDGSSDGGFDTRVRPMKPAGNWESGQSGRAMENLRHAYQLHLSGEEPERILITLEYALALDARQPAFHILAGLMALRTFRGKRAEGAFRKAINLLDDATRRSEVGVYLAWALDLQNQRQAAKKLYSRLITDPTVEPAVVLWAKRGRRRRFRERDAYRLNIDFFLATVLDP